MSVANTLMYLRGLECRANGSAQVEEKVQQIIHWKEERKMRESDSNEQSNKFLI